MWHFLEIRAHMRNFPEKRWRIRVQKGLQNNENASIFIKNLFAHLSRLDFRVQNEICKFQSALAMVKILLFSLLLLLCHWSHFLCHGRSLGKPKSLSMGMNWNQLRLTIGTKEEKPPGIQYQRILLISALLHLFLLPLPCNLAVTTPVKNWCIIILSQESDIFSIPFIKRCF